jgi:hypothetical protein
METPDNNSVENSRLLKKPLNKGMAIISAAAAAGILSVITGCGKTTSNPPGHASCDSVTASVASLRGTTLPRGSSDVALGCWDIANGCRSHSLAALTVYDGGLHAGSDFSGGFILKKGAAEIGGPASEQNSTIKFTDMSSDLPVNSITNICISNDIPRTVMAGSQHAFQIRSAGDMGLNPGTSVSGNFPLTGPTFSIGGN